jgi:hypothetical protein
MCHLGITDNSGAEGIPDECSVGPWASNQQRDFVNFQMCERLIPNGLHPYRKHYFSGSNPVALLKTGFIR